MIKNIVLTAILVFWGWNSFANIPQKIYSITRQNLPAAHYQEQINLWQQELDKNSKNADAWFNYFMAHNVLFQKGKLNQADLEKVNTALKTAIPNSFEAYFAQYTLDNKIENLQKAYDLAPQRYETYQSLITHYETQQDRQKVMELCQKWLVSGEYSTGLLHWNYNVLVGLDEQSVILTEGEQQSVPLWLLQYGKNIRKDVQVIDLQLLTNADYRNVQFHQLAIPALQSNDKLDIVHHLMKNCNKNALYLGISLSKNLSKDYEEELYIVGLAFRHSTEEFDNISALIDNYENKFLLDYLKVNLSSDISGEIVAQNNMNYLPAFLILYHYYQEKNDWDKANSIKNLSFKIAAAAQKEQELSDYLNKNFKSGGSQPLVQLSYREIEEDFASMDYHHNLYASITEVSNEQYELFLTDLLKRKEFDQLQARKIHLTDWRSFFPNALKNIGDEVVFEHGKPDAPKAPIQNISYESAVAYCDWLTTVYNNIDHKKKKFKQVKFRLPTEQEWMLAASMQSPNIRLEQSKQGKIKLAGEKDWKSASSIQSPSDFQEIFPQATDLKYPWQGANERNAKGCFLANFNTDNEKPCVDCEPTKNQALDGVYFTAAIDAYFPNGYGLYNTVGNVAEMIQEKGKAKGGSWFHTPAESTIQGVQNYKEPQPYIGFRVFMEVLEEGSEEQQRKGMVGPPGTLQLKGKLYMDEMEITNMNWREYLSWVQKNDAKNYENCLLDTLAWVDTVGYFEPFKVHYHSHPAYNDYPAVCMSHEQAKNYCAWRTDRVNEMIALNPSLQKRFGKVLYRLPTENEWEYAASGGLDKRDFPYGLEALEIPRGVTVNLNMFDEKNAGVAGALNDNAYITAPVRSYLPNKKGFYTMIGNVAEMVVEKGISKGGAWKHRKEVSKIKDRILYSKPTHWLGFRCICETNL